jgi:hypothetical protein
MIASNPGLAALFGGPLTGNALVRNIYSDEAGTSSGEPNSIVVALIVHPDTQWRRLSGELKRLIQEDVPPQFREGFVSHAKDLTSQKKFPGWDGRYAFLRKVMQIPSRFNIPVCIGAVRRGTAIARGQVGNLKPFEIDHLYAFILSMSWADKYLRQYCGDEMAQVIAEKHDLEKVLRAGVNEVRKYPLALPTIITGKRDGNSIKRIEQNKVERVVDEVHFAAKADSPILQIADACAYGIRRFFAGESYGESYLEEILGKEYCDSSFQKVMPEGWGHYANMRVFDKPLQSL